MHKVESILEEKEFEIRKVLKDNQFLKNRVEALEIENQEILTKNSGRFSDSFTSRNDDNLADLVDMNDLGDQGEKIVELEDEIRLLKKNHQMLISNQSSDKQSLLQKISQVERDNDDKDLEIKKLTQ